MAIVANVSRTFDVSLGDDVVATRGDSLFERRPANFLPAPAFCVMPDETVIGVTREDDSQFGEIQVLTHWSDRLP